MHNIMYFYNKNINNFIMKKIRTIFKRLDFMTFQEANETSVKISK